MRYAMHLLIYFNIYTLLALSLNLLVGYAGLLSLAHAAFFAIGGYVYALLAVRLQADFGTAIVAGVGIASLLSLMISIPAWRLRGDYFVLSTLATQALVFSALNNWFDPDALLGSMRNLTNGPFGIAGIPRPSMFGMVAGSTLAMAAVAGFVCAVCAFAVWRLTMSPWGRLLKAVRDDELVARGLGKNARKVKVQVVGIASALASVAGALYAAYAGYIDPSSGTVSESISLLSIVVIGGLGNFRGPIVGAMVLLVVPEALRFLDLPEAQAAHLRLLIFGTLLVALIHRRPQGLAGSFPLQ